MLASSYLYASGKIRALEPKVLDRTDIERMVDAPDFTTAFKVLNDTDYANNLLDIQPHNYRDALRADLTNVFELLSIIIPDPCLLKVLFIKRDYLNIKLLLKQKFFGVELSSSLVGDTLYPLPPIQDMIMEGKTTSAPAEMRASLSRILKQLGSEPSPSQIDTITTRMYFEHAGQLAKKINNRFLTKLLEVQINGLNILNLIRGKRLGLDGSELEKHLVPGGSIDSQSLLKLYEAENSELRPLVSRHFDLEALQRFNSFLENDNLHELEKSFEDFEIRFLRQAKMVAYGPEVVVAYFYAKRNADRNVRLIMTGKLNNMPGDEIKKTLREVY